MFLELSSAEGHEQEIRAFRQQIGNAMGMRAEGPLLEPLPHAFYLFAYQEHDQPPAGMIEFFFYEDAFASYEKAVYNEAYDLSSIGPMNELVHVRSLVVKDQHRGSLFVHLCSAMIEVSSALSRRYLTVVTRDNQNAALRFYQNAGMQRLGTLLIQGEPHTLCGVDLESGIRLFNRLRRGRSLVDSAILITQMRDLIVAARSC